jgi:hypothetical protein
MQTLEVLHNLLVRNLRGLGGLLLLCLAVTLSVAGTMAAEPDQAGLVVLMDDGRVETRCITFDEAEISGAELLARSGLDHIIDPASGMGLIVCQIEGVGCDHPAEPCFCQCMGGGECVYWNYFYRDPYEEEWTYSGLGAAMHQVRAGSVDAWVWGDGRTPPAGELDFDAICAPPTPVPIEAPESTVPVPPASTNTLTATSAAISAATKLPTATVLPTATAPALASVARSGAAAAAGPSPADQDRATAPPPNVGPSPAAAGDQNLASYWPFAAIVLGLSVAGCMVWLRRR